MTELTNKEFEILCLILKLRLQNKRWIPISIFLQFNWSIEESNTALHSLKAKGFLDDWQIGKRKSGLTKVYFKLPKQIASNLDLDVRKMRRRATQRNFVLLTTFKEKKRWIFKKKPPLVS